MLELSPELLTPCLQYQYLMPPLSPLNTPDQHRISRHQKAHPLRESFHHAPTPATCPAIGAAPRKARATRSQMMICASLQYRDHIRPMANPHPKDDRPTPVHQHRLVWPKGSAQRSRRAVQASTDRLDAPHRHGWRPPGRSNSDRTGPNPCSATFLRDISMRCSCCCGRGAVVSARHPDSGQ